MKVLFRLDANKHIATGHAMRCLSISDALREMGHEAVFVMASGDFKDLINKRGYRCRVLDTDYRHMTKELPAFMKILEDEGPDMVVVDSYYASYDFMKKVRERCKLIYIDDLCEKKLSCDGLINYNIYGPYMDYESLYGKKLPTLLLGPSYAPLRAEFKSIDPCERENESFNFLLSTGGADPYHMAKTVAEEFLKKGYPYSRMTLSLLVGGFSEDYDYLMSLSKSNQDRIEVYKNITEMARFLTKFDGAASAAGSTSYELCCMKVPAILYATAHNQENILKYFDELKVFPKAGDMRDDGDEVIKNILNFMKKLYEEKAYSDGIREREAGVTDGKGAVRIVEFMKKIIKEG